MSLMKGGHSKLYATIFKYQLDVSCQMCMEGQTECSFVCADLWEADWGQAGSILFCFGDGSRCRVKLDTHPPPPPPPPHAILILPVYIVKVSKVQMQLKNP